jgi:hypothetical protein
MTQQVFLMDHGPIVICHSSEDGYIIIWTRSRRQFMETSQIWVAVWLSWLGHLSFNIDFRGSNLDIERKMSTAFIHASFEISIHSLGGHSPEI